MIASDGRVVLGDFGLALNIKDKSHGEVFGSPHYISPEQARRSSDAVPQSDLYSLGVILYEMLTGATPFNDPSPASLALQHITEPPPLPRSINPGLSTSVEDVLLKILEKKPTDRYQTGQSLMAAVSKAVADKPVATPTDAPPLPPIPVNAPTIQRSNIPLSSFTKQRDVITALQKHSTTTQRAAVDNLPVLQPRPKRKLTGLVFIIPLFLSVLVLGWKFRPDLFSFLYPAPPTATATVTVAVISNTEPAATIKIPATDTLLPKPTITQIIPTMPMLLATATQTQAVTQTATATLTVTPTQTQTVVAKSKTPTITATIAQSVSPTSTIAYPNGYLMTAFYNENSFYILNKGKASRSVSGFMFERILADGTFGNQFAGWEWEKYFGILYQNRCISLEIDKSPLAYLNPPECENRVLSNLKPAFDSATLFWTPNDNSKEFRILWLSEEIARCTIETGVCDFRVP